MFTPIISPSLVSSVLFKFSSLIHVIFETNFLNTLEIVNE